MNRLDLAQTETAGIDELRGGASSGKRKAEGALEGAKEKIPGVGSSDKERSR